MMCAQDLRAPGLRTCPASGAMSRSLDFNHAAVTQRLREHCTTKLGEMVFTERVSTIRKTGFVHRLVATRLRTARSVVASGRKLQQDAPMTFGEAGKVSGGLGGVREHLVTLRESLRRSSTISIYSYDIYVRYPSGSLPTKGDSLRRLGRPRCTRFAAATCLHASPGHAANSSAVNQPPCIASSTAT